MGRERFLILSAVGGVWAFCLDCSSDTPLDDLRFYFLELRYISLSDPGFRVEVLQTYYWASRQVVSNLELRIYEVQQGVKVELTQALSGKAETR